jgi:hypothetical protein
MSCCGRRFTAKVALRSKTRESVEKDDDSPATPQFLRGLRWLIIILSGIATCLSGLVDHLK